MQMPHGNCSTSKQHGLGCPREIEEEPCSMLVLEVHFSCVNIGVGGARMVGEKRLFV